MDVLLDGGVEVQVHAEGRVRERQREGGSKDRGAPKLSLAVPMWRRRRGLTAPGGESKSTQGGHRGDAPARAEFRRWTVDCQNFATTLRGNYWIGESNCSNSCLPPLR